jgi:Replication-relaxation
MTASARGSGLAGRDRLARKVAELAGRLTERDRHLCRLLAEHRVLTSRQLTELAFDHRDTAEDRLRTLTTLEVLDRFRPRRDTGSAPYHYVLGPAGAAVLAAEQGIGVADLGY